MGKAEGVGAGGAIREKGAIPGRFLRWVYVAAGTIFLALGIIGIFLPLLPTTPFLLLAAACYARGSRRLYRWLLDNKVFGRYIRDYREGRGIPLRAKILALAFLWATIFISAWFFVRDTLLRVLLVVIAGAVSAHILAIRTLGRQGAPGPGRGLS